MLNVIKEMTRVCRRGGFVVIVDIVALNSEDNSLQDEMNRLERLRDPSHTTALTIHQLCELLITSTDGLLCIENPDIVNEREGNIECEISIYNNIIYVIIYF